MALHTLEVGTGNTDTIVFIHGAALGGWMWRLQLGNLADTFHCLAPDLPGHGKSDGDYSFESATLAVANLIRDKAHGGKAYVVGLSLGGLVAVNLIDKHPDLLHKVIVSAPPSGPVPGTGILTVMMRFMLPLFKSDFVIRRTADQLKLPEQDYENFRQSQKTVSADLLLTVAREVHAHRLPERLHNATIPTLAVVGENEIAVNFRVVRDLVELMPAVQGRVAPQVGHGWNGENPDLFNRMIREWFLNDMIADDLLPLSSS